MIAMGLFNVPSNARQRVITITLDSAADKVVRFVPPIVGGLMVAAAVVCATNPDAPFTAIITCGSGSITLGPVAAGNTIATGKSVTAKAAETAAGSITISGGATTGGTVVFSLYFLSAQ